MPTTAAGLLRCTAGSASPTRSTGTRSTTSGRTRRSEADRLPDEHDVDAARQLLVDLEDLPDRAVLAVGGGRPGVLELQAVLVDPLVRRLQGRDELLRADHEDDAGGAPGVGGELAARGRGDDQRAVAGDRVHAAQGVVGLAADRL